MYLSSLHRAYTVNSLVILDLFVNFIKKYYLAAKIRQIEINLFDFFTAFNSSYESLYNILEQITVTIPV